MYARRFCNVYRGQFTLRVRGEKQKKKLAKLNKIKLVWVIVIL